MRRGFPRLGRWPHGDSAHPRRHGPAWPTRLRPATTQTAASNNCDPPGRGFRRRHFLCAGMSKNEGRELRSYIPAEAIKCWRPPTAAATIRAPNAAPRFTKTHPLGAALIRAASDCSPFPARRCLHPSHVKAVAEIRKSQWPDGRAWHEHRICTWCRCRCSHWKCCAWRGDRHGHWGRYLLFRFGHAATLTPRRVGWAPRSSAVENGPRCRCAMHTLLLSIVTAGGSYPLSQLQATVARCFPVARLYRTGRLSQVPSVFPSLVQSRAYSASP